MHNVQPLKSPDQVSEDWTINRLLGVSFLIRALFIFYANIHDYIFKVKFTDIDYTIYSDAAFNVYNGRSPYDRATYRYSPVLAYLLVPNVVYVDYGKFLFSLIDVLTGWLIYLNGCKFIGSAEVFDQFKLGLSVFWLFNPFIAIISSRGNADTVVCSCIALLLYLLATKKIVLAAVVHGMLAIHLRIYPIIYLPSVYFYFAKTCRDDSLTSWFRKLLLNTNGIIYCLICIQMFLITVAGGYYLYGQQFLDEYLLYHVRRQDIKHNFSPYFYPIYLTMNNPSLASVLTYGAFIPQLFCIVYFALRLVFQGLSHIVLFRYSSDLTFCWFVTTFSFVNLNKVCTSQYFVWYLMYLPFICYKTNLCLSKAVKLVMLWFFGQALWLLPAYLLEFQGWQVMELVWLASISFLCINFYILHSICLSYSEINEKKS